MRDLPRAHRLADGATVYVRHVRPTDERVLRAAFRELSPSSRYQRFLGPVTELSDSLWRDLCDVDGRDHFALVALSESESRAVGVARGDPPATRTRGSAPGEWLGGRSNDRGPALRLTRRMKEETCPPKCKTPATR